MAKPKKAEKPEQSKERTVAEIQQEYTGLAAKTGQLQYQVFTLSKDIQLLNEKMRDLNFEAAGVQARAAEAAKAQGAPSNG